MTLQPMRPGRVKFYPYRPKMFDILPASNNSTFIIAPGLKRPAQGDAITAHDPDIPMNAFKSIKNRKTHPVQHGNLRMGNAR